MTNTVLSDVLLCLKHTRGMIDCNQSTVWGGIKMNNQLDVSSWLGEVEPDVYPLHLAMKAIPEIFILSSRNLLPKLERVQA